MTIALIFVMILVIAILTLVSYTERLYTEAGKFLSREFQENIQIFEQQVEPRIGLSRQRAALSMALLEQLSTATITLIISYTVFASRQWGFSEILQTVVLVVLVIILFNRFLPYLFFSRTRGSWLISLVPVLRILIYLTLPVTLVLGFLQSVVSLTKENIEEQPEHPSEAVDALIEAGQDEGILEESDRDLIHSVLEFGDKIVREVMTPRPQIVAVPLETTVEQLTELLRAHAFSRIPVYQGDIDHIKGLVHSHDILQVPDTEARVRTVADLMKTDLYFVPETKLVSELLRELQHENLRMAIVIDEYGGVAGVVTIEDLVEEIVGEIRDEREGRAAAIVRENDYSYVVPGSTDADHLEELFGQQLEDFNLDEWEATTVAGFVTEIAGHIPQRGEVVEHEGIVFEILDATPRRVERVRIRLKQPPQRGGQVPEKLARGTKQDERR
jgi:putative hemolysin